MLSTDRFRNVTRRNVLAGLAGVGAGLGAFEASPVGSTDDRRGLSLTIKTLPADADPAAIRIARRLSTALRHVGIAATIVPLSRRELSRDVLLDRDFELYVARHPGHDDPDFLRPLLHSRYADGAGWQNPFGYEDGRLDALLDAQTRRAPAARRNTLHRIQRVVAREQPFTVVAVPHEIRAFRLPSVDGGWSLPLHAVRSYLALGPPSESDGGGDDRLSRTETRDAGLRVTLTDSRPTENLNPLSAPNRTGGPVVSLLYDSLGRRIDGVVTPWLASRWRWERTDGGALTAEVALRSGLRWHDGTPLDADDVAFTYRFLADTALGEVETSVPAPTYRGRSDLVESVERIADDRVRMRVATDAPRVAARAFTVPVLPAHVWRPRAAEATLASVSSDRPVTKALVAKNLPPVGSGPLRYRDSTPEESLVLEPFEEHFLARDDVAGSLAEFAGGFAFDHLTFRVVPSSATALDLLRRGGADVSGSPLTPAEAGRIGRTSDLGFRVRRSSAFYHVGYNHRVGPLGDPAFRRVVARLVDERYLVREAFTGYATPASSPITDDSWLAPSLAWNDDDPSLPYFGTDGVLDVPRARRAFRDAGYHYGPDGTMVVP